MLENSLFQLLVNVMMLVLVMLLVYMFSASECVNAALLGKNVNVVLLAMLLLLLWL